MLGFPDPLSQHGSDRPKGERWLDVSFFVVEGLFGISFGRSVGLTRPFFLPKPY